MPGKLKHSRQAVVDAINHTNQLWDDPLTLERIALGYAQDITEPGAKKNTRLLVYALNGSGLRGTQNVTYDRLSFTRYFLNITVFVFGEPVQKASDVLHLVNDKYQTEIRKEDIIDVDVSGLGEDWIVEIQPRPGNVMWTGSFKLRYARHIPTLDELIVNNVVDVVKAPYQLGAKPRAEFLSYAYDYTEMSAMLDAMVVGATVTDAQVEAMNVAANLNFSTAVPAELPKGAVGLYGAKVKAVRVAVTPDSKYNPIYQKVAVITLAATSNYAGDLFLHYAHAE